MIDAGLSLPVTPALRSVAWRCFTGEGTLAEDPEWGAWWPLHRPWSDLEGQPFVPLGTALGFTIGLHRIAELLGWSPDALQGLHLSGPTFTHDRDGDGVYRVVSAYAVLRRCPARGRDFHTWTSDGSERRDILPGFLDLYPFPREQVPGRFVAMLLRHLDPEQRAGAFVPASPEQDGGPHDVREARFFGMLSRAVVGYRRENDRITERNRGYVEMLGERNERVRALTDENAALRAELARFKQAAQALATTEPPTADHVEIERFDADATGRFVAGRERVFEPGFYAVLYAENRLALDIVGPYNGPPWAVSAAMESWPGVALHSPWVVCPHAGRPLWSAPGGELQTEFEPESNPVSCTDCGGAGFLPKTPVQERQTVCPWPDCGECSPAPEGLGEATVEVVCTWCRRTYSTNIQETVT